MSTRAEFDAYVAEHGAPERIELLLCDLNAVLRGKWLPGDAIDKLDKGAVRLPMSTYAPSIMGYELGGTGFGIAVGDPDGVLVPISGTLKPAPWASAPAAQMLVDMCDVDGTICALSARNILKTVLDRFAAKGLRPVVASELEFYVLQVRESADEAPRPPSRTPDAQNYAADSLFRHEPLVLEILDAAKRQGLPTDTLVAEYGQGQFEINFKHSDDVMGAADATVLFRHLVRSVVSRFDYEATFMAKPYADQPGNGMHLHVSLLDASGRNVFTPSAGEEIAAPLRHAVAGLLDTVEALQAVFAPHMNSFRRFQPKSFAPSTPTWGLDHRAAGVRLPEVAGPAARLEHRICGADVNPYLAFAAILGGVLHGLEQEREPPEAARLDGDSPEPENRLSQDWAGAVDRLAASDVAADILGPAYRDVYVAVRRGEIGALSQEISPVEYRYYLSAL
ncbi:MAG: glutamine synthetase family protein [Pseudomonadota bacterium]